MKKVVLIFLCGLLYISLYNQQSTNEINDKIKKAENNKNPIEVFKTSLWLYRRGYYKEFVKLFQKALEVDKYVNKDKMKLPEILGYVKFEIKKQKSDEDEDDEEFEEEKEAEKKYKNIKKDSQKPAKEIVYDSITKRFKYLMKNLKADETIFEQDITKKTIVQLKLKSEKEKIGIQFENKLISSHFILYTNIDLETSIKILDNLEAFFNTFYFFFYEAIDIKKFKSKKITIMVLKDREEYNKLISERYDVRKDEKPIDLYFHLRRNDSSLFDIKNNVSIGTITTDIQLQSGKNIKNITVSDFVLALPEIYKAVFENFLYTYIFDENKKAYASISQCLWNGLRTYFAYLIPGEIAFVLGSYAGSEPFFDIKFTKEAIERKEVSSIKSLLTTNNFEDPMREFKKYDAQTYIRIYTTQCYSIIYYLFHRTNQAEIENIIKQLSNPANFNYNFISQYIKSDRELSDFICNDLQKELDKFRAK
ncbi:MAG: hypothetical protein ACK4NF_02415 [Planctomycetota bacterium]